MDKRYIYLASGIFNGGTNMLNAYLCMGLEKKGYSCYLPQRDGFELAQVIAFLETVKTIKGLTPDIISEIGHYVPYYVDLGYFMRNSKAIVANLDDPIDDGMVVEISYGHIFNLPVITYRTDLRTPFGNVTDALAINPFPPQQSDVFIRSKVVVGDYQSVLAIIDETVDSIETYLRQLIPKKKNQMEASDNVYIKGILKGADILFEGLQDIHTKENIIKIAERYICNRDFFVTQIPKVVTIT